MNTHILDTYAAVEHLVKGNTFTEKVVDVITDIGDGVSTKKDLEILKHEINNRILTVALTSIGLILGGMYTMFKVF